MIKKRIFRLSIFVVCLFVIGFLLAKPILRLSTKALLRYIAYKTLDAKIDYEDLSFANKSIILKNVHVYNQDVVLKSEQVHLSFLQKIVDIHLELIEPKIELYRSPNILRKKFKKPSLFQLSCTVNKGEIAHYVENNKSKIIHFSYHSNKSSKMQKIALQFANNGSAYIDLTSQKRQRFAGLQVQNVPLEEFYEFLSVLEPKLTSFEMTKGFLNGYGSISWQGKSVDRFLFQFDVSKLQCKNKNFSLQLLADPIFVEMEYLLEKAPIDSSFFSFIPKNIASHLRFKVSVDQAKVISLHTKDELSIFASHFSYNPGVGPKLKMSGTLISSDDEMNYCLETKGYLQSFSSNWLDAKLDLKDTDLASCHLKIQDLSKETFSVQVQMQDVLARHIHLLQNGFLDFFYPKLLKKVKIDEGKISSSFTFFFCDKQMQSVDVSHVLADKIALRWQEKDLDLFCGCMEGSLFFHKNNIWKTFSSDLKLQDSSFSKSQLFHFSKINAHLTLQDGNFQKGLLSFFTDDQIEHQAALIGSVDKVQFKDKISGNLENLVKYFPMKEGAKLKCLKRPFCLDLCFSNEKEQSKLKGNLNIDSDEKWMFGCYLPKLSTLISSVSLDNLQDQIKQGWIRGKNFDLDSYMHLFYETPSLKGKKSELSLYYQNEVLELYLKGDELVYTEPNMTIYFEPFANKQDVCFEEDSIKIKLDCITKDFRILIDSFDATFYLPTFHTSFSSKKTHLELTPKTLQMHSNAIQSENIHFSGKVTLEDNAKKIHVKASHFEGDLFSINQFLKHFHPSVPLPRDVRGSVNGNFAFSTSLIDDAPKNFPWRVEANFKDLSFVLSEKAKIHHLGAYINWNHEKSWLEIEDLFAKLEMENTTYNIRAPTFRKKTDSFVWDYDLFVDNKLWHVFHAFGSVFTDENKQIYIKNPKVQFFGEEIQIQDLVFDENFSLQKCLIETKVADNFSRQWQFFYDLGLFRLKPLIDQKQKIKANIHCEYNKGLNNNSSIDLKVSDLLLLSQEKKHHLHLLAKKREKTWDISSHFDEFFGSLKAVDEEDHYRIKSFEVTKDQDLFFSSEGIYRKNDAKFIGNHFDCKIDLEKSLNTLRKIYPVNIEQLRGFFEGRGTFILDFSHPMPNMQISGKISPGNFFIEKVAIESKRAILLNFSTKNGFEFKGIDLSFFHRHLDLSNLLCNIDSLVVDYQNDLFFAHNFQLSVPHTIFKDIERWNQPSWMKKLINFSIQTLDFKKDFDLLADIHWKRKDSNLEIFAKNGQYHFLGKQRNFKDIVFAKNRAKCQLTFEYQHEDRWYKISNDIAFLDKISANIRLFDEENSNNPLTINCSSNEKGNFLLLDMHGQFSGIDVGFFQDHQSLALMGRMKIDFSKAKYLLPKYLRNMCQTCHLGKGYELKGKFLLKNNNQSTFDGTILGKKMEIGGWEFKTLLGQIHYRNNHVLIENLKISDQSGIVHIQKTLCTKNEENDWILSIPKIHIHEFRPSLLKEIKKKPSKLEPLLVQDMLVFDVFGKFNDLNSITGKGRLSFINSFKRSYSIFDVPADLLGRILGLDLELLIPVRGVIDFSIKDAKFFLTKMQDTYSQATRSEFYLIEDHPNCYLDFKGNLNIDIKMKQYVLFKITENFIMSIKGNLDKPDIRLKKKRGFLAS